MRLFLVLVLLAVPGVAYAQVADSVLIGCYGGVRGGGSGNKLARNGDLWSFEKPLQTEARYTLLRRDPAAAALVFAELERVRFRSLRFNTVTNMTCVLELNDSAGEHKVSWPRGALPAELEPVLAALIRAFGDDRRMW